MLPSYTKHPKSEQKFDQHYFLGKVLFALLATYIYMPWVRFVWVKMVKHIDISQQVFVSSKVKKCSLTLQVHNLHIYVCKSTCRRSVCTHIQYYDKYMMYIFMCVHVCTCTCIIYTYTILWQVHHIVDIYICIIAFQHWRKFVL